MTNLAIFSWARAMPAGEIVDKCWKLCRYAFQECVAGSCDVCLQNDLTCARSSGQSRGWLACSGGANFVHGDVNLLIGLYRFCTVWHTRRMKIAMPTNPYSRPASGSGACRGSNHCGIRNDFSPHMVPSPNTSARDATGSLPPRIATSWPNDSRVGTKSRQRQ
jgi:hypothetical protein